MKRTLKLFLFNATLFCWSFICVFCCVVLQHQPKFGMKTISLAVPPPAPIFFQQPNLYARRQQYCLAQNIYFEARGESINGQYAVGFVTINRLRSSSFPNNLCGVVYQKRLATCQFSWYCDEYSDRPRHGKAWRRSQAIAAGIWDGYYKHQLLLDITNGALYFFNPHKVNVRVNRESIVTIDHQVFYN